MSSIIKLGCACGATFEMDCGEYINRRGQPDERKRVFIAELRADEWLDRHQRCQQMVVGRMNLPTANEE